MQSRPRREQRLRARTQQGFTLIELMIALFIGLFLLAGLGTLVQSNKRVFLSQGKLAQLQDGERLAMSMITDVVQETGYYPSPVANTPASTMLALAQGASGATQAMSAGQTMTGTDSATPPGDVITVRFATANNDGILNCTGTSNTTGAVYAYVNTFSVNPSGQLVCNQNGTAYPLVAGVTNLSVLYGVNTLGTGNNVDTYMNATQVTKANAWGNVISVHIALEFSNPLYVAANPQGQPPTVTLQRQVSVMNQLGL